MLTYVAKHSTQAAMSLILFFCFLDFSLGVVAAVSSARAVESESGNKSAISTYWPLWIRCTSLFGTGGEEALTVNGVSLVVALGDTKGVVCGREVASVDPVGGKWGVLREKSGKVERDVGNEDRLLEPVGKVQYRGILWAAATTVRCNRA